MCEWTLDWKIIFLILFLPLISRGWLKLLLDLFDFYHGASEENKGSRDQDFGPDSDPGEPEHPDEPEPDQSSQEEDSDNLLGSTSSENGDGDIPDSTWASNDNIRGSSNSGFLAIRGERDERDPLPLLESGLPGVSEDAEAWLGSNQSAYGQARCGSTIGGSGEDI